jgi:hypothetical protein
MNESCVTNEENAGAGLVSDHSGYIRVVDTYRLAVGSPLSLLTFFAAAKKVSAAPHRGEANRPITKQGKTNTPGTTAKKQAAAGKPPAHLQGKKNQLALTTTVHVVPAESTTPSGTRSI